MTHNNPMNLKHDHIIKVEQDEVRVTYTRYSAGCTVFGIAFMALVSLGVVLFIPGSGFSRTLLGYLIGGVGTLFFGIALLRIVMTMMQGKTLMKVKDGKLINRNQSIELGKIKALEYGWHNRKPSGRVFTSVVVDTTDNKTLFFTYYNIVSDHAIEEFLDTFVVPQITPEGQTKWRISKESKAESR
ncbi:MAG: DUF5381 family protein [Bacillota bacterium]